jgi:CheY-like chemotaxis protein
MRNKCTGTSLLKNLFIKSSTTPNQTFYSLYIWIAYLAINLVFSIVIIIQEMSEGNKFDLRLFLTHGLSLAFFCIIAIFISKLELIWGGIKELIGLVIIIDQIYFIIESNFSENRSLDFFVQGYAGLSITATLIFYDTVPHLARTLLYHTALFLYGTLCAFRRQGEKPTIGTEQVLRFLLFVYVISLGNSFVLVKLRYTYLYQKLVFEKTIKNWKKVMDMSGIGISIERDETVKYRNKKYKKYISQIGGLEDYAKPTGNENFILRKDEIYFAGATSKLYIVEDITDIKKAEQIKYNNLLIATITHELRTPLNIIMAILGLFVEGSVYLNMKEDASKALCAASMQETLINDILDMAKISNGNLLLNPQPTDIHSFLHSIYELFKFKIDKAIEFTLQIDSSTPKILSLDERRYRQILLNLLSNASKFTTSGFIKIEAKYDGNSLITSVKDSGVGIEEKNYPKLFTQFGMLEDSMQLNKSGTGLGLNLCKSLSHIMGGDITFKSKYKVGSEFMFTVSATIKTLKTPIKRAWSTELKLVIVDDNNMNIEVLKSFAKKAKIEYSTFNDSEKALNSLKEECHSFIGFFDLNMPTISGYDLAQSIRTNSKKCKLIAVTGEDTQKVFARCKECGFDEVIEKPVTYKKFCLCLE